MQFQDTILSVRSTLLAVRDTDGDGKKSDLTFNLLIGLISLLFIGASVMAILMVLRGLKMQRRMRNEGILPQHNEVHKRTGNHRRLTIQTGDGRQSVLVFNNSGHPMLANPHSPPHSPDNVPEIRVTFPDEQDDNGRPKSGRVVVVRVGDTSIGMEPLHHDDEQLPAYEKESNTQFYSIDMEKIGGLKEKDYQNSR